MADPKEERRPMMTPFMVGELSDIVVAASCAAILKGGWG